MQCEVEGGAARSVWTCVRNLDYVLQNIEQKHFILYKQMRSEVLCYCGDRRCLYSSECKFTLYGAGMAVHGGAVVAVISRHCTPVF